MFQNKKLKRNATYAIAEVAKVALCASNCTLPTSGKVTWTTDFAICSCFLGKIKVTPGDQSHPADQSHPRRRYLT